MRKKVFASGCYDMLHSGHVAFFEEAAKLGDLYVGLGSNKTLFELKGRKTINKDAERLYMVKALRCVKDAWIGSGSGIMDFEKEVRELHPDIFFVNTDGYTPEKRAFCEELSIELVVSHRVPEAGLPAHSTTALRQECRIPYREELCGGWLNQPSVNSICPGSAIVMSIEPTMEFNDKAAWPQVHGKSQWNYGRRRFRPAIEKNWRSCSSVSTSRPAPERSADRRISWDCGYPASTN